jgi:hypothetical protein
MLPALKFSTSGCQFEVGPVGLAPTETHMVVGAPRSYHTLRASTLATLTHLFLSQDVLVRKGEGRGRRERTPPSFLSFPPDAQTASGLWPLDTDEDPKNPKNPRRA